MYNHNNKKKSIQIDRMYTGTIQPNTVIFNIHALYNH